MIDCQPRHRTVIAGAILALLASGTAAAQDAAQASATAARQDAGLLDEVVVTARKREETIISVPISVTAVTDSMITERGIIDMRDLAMYTPGFSLTQAFGRQSLERPTVRGQTNILGEPVASFFVDGVYLSGSVTQTEMSNIERVEIIKGPQAALYGRGTYAGAINYVTRVPTNEFSGKLEGTYGEHDLMDLSGTLSGPIVSDKLAFLVGARYYEYGGEYTNTWDGRRTGEEQSKSATAKLRWTPTENLDINLLGTWQEDDDGIASVLFQGRTFNNCLPNSPSTPRARGYHCGEVVDLPLLESAARSSAFDAVGEPGGVQRERSRVALTANWDFAGGYEFVSATGYSEEDYTNNIDVSYAAYDPLAAYFVSVAAGMATQRPYSDATVDVQRQYASPGSFWRIGDEQRHDFSQELRISSPTDDRFRWTGGVYYFKGSFDTTRDDKIWPDPYVIVPNGQATLTYRDFENKAVFGGIEFDINAQWTVTGEVRYAEDDIQQTTAAFPAVAAVNGLVPPTTVVTRSQVQEFQKTFKSTTPRFTLRYKPNDTMMYYANIAQGNKPGGFQSGTTASLLTVIGREDEIAFEEEEVDSYELGAKFMLMGNRVSLNLAAFYNDLYNQQLTTNLIDPVSGIANSLIQNVGRTEVKGFELELGAQITSRWNVSAGYAYVDSTIKEFLSSDEADLYSPRTGAQFRPYNVITNPNGCVVSTSVAPPAGRLSCQALRDLDNAEYGDVSGNKTPRAPEHQGFVSTRYDGDFRSGLGWFVGGDVTYEGSKWAQVHNLLETGDRTYLNLRAGLETDTWMVMLWGRNVTDDDTPLDILRYIDPRGLTSQQVIIQGLPQPRGFTITPPRQHAWGITASWKF